MASYFSALSFRHNFPCHKVLCGDINLWVKSNVYAKLELCHVRTMGQFERPMPFPLHCPLNVSNRILLSAKPKVRTVLHFPSHYLNGDHDCWLFHVFCATFVGQILDKKKDTNAILFFTQTCLFCIRTYVYLMGFKPTIKDKKHFWLSVFFTLCYCRPIKLVKVVFRPWFLGPKHEFDHRNPGRSWFLSWWLEIRQQ